MATAWPPQAGGVEYPVAVALAEAVPTLPKGPGWWYEIKFDGHRTVLWRDAETVRLQARSGRTVTTAWMDLAVAGMRALRPGTVLDGEAVIYAENRIDFAAAQSRANSGPARAGTRCAPPCLLCRVRCPRLRRPGRPRASVHRTPRSAS
ncbi:hypothetical protein ACIHCV_43435 [Streptomyces sp. NPDC051956]|uniref:ATP-dependent DNA ligase n=1 Tax=Streptomyces sp. NPDC051956 TaxID=3365677 RepID=UPI0037CD9D08